MSGARILDLRWSAILNDFRRSGLTHAAFCHRRELSIHTFRKRLYAARAAMRTTAADRPTAGHGSAFVPVTILPDPAPAVAAIPQALEVILQNGRRIAVTPGFDPQTLRRLITVVEDRPGSV